MSSRPPAASRPASAVRNSSLQSSGHRCGEKVWNAAESINTRPPFPEWNAPLDSNEYTPRTRQAMTGMIDMSEEELSKTSTISTKLFPSDHALIVLSRLQSTPIAWLSIYKDNHVFGLRAVDGVQPGRPKNKAPGPPTAKSSYVAHFVCEFEDGMRIVAKEGVTHPAQSTVGITMTMPTGLVTTVNSDGQVFLTYVSVSKVGLPGPVQEELSRSIRGGGTVTRRLRDGTFEVFQADGTTLRQSGSTYIMTCPNGERRRVTIDPDVPIVGESDPYPGLVYEPLQPVETEEDFDSETYTRPMGPDGGPLPPPCSEQIDPETGAHVRMCLGTTFVTFSDGSTLARFRDGTTIKSDPARAFVLVEAPGYPSIHVDVDIDKTARHHSRGVKVPIAKGGERMRNRLALPDGTTVSTTYNTKVTSKVRGKVVVVRPDLSEIVATDSSEVESCTVLFRPRGTWVGGSIAELDLGDPEEADAAKRIEAEKRKGLPPKKERTNADSEPDIHCGAYEFNLFHGKMVMEDFEHNVFFASVNPEKVEKNEKGATYDVDLAGKIQGDDIKAEAVVNAPMSPRLFIMNRDGSVESSMAQRRSGEEYGCT